MVLRTVVLIGIIASLLVGCAASTVTVVPTAVHLSDSATGQFHSQQIGFEPQRDGFSFRNYGAKAGIINLTNSDMQRLFGDAVCILANKSCTLIPAARIWMEEINRAMQTGHCEGMAVLSQYFYYGVLNPKIFGGTHVADLQLTDNSALQREIAYWWATQATFPTRSHRVVTDPVEAVALLRAGLQKDASVAQLYTLGIYQADFLGGHTVTPIGLRDIDATHVAIQIYDNNIPNETREITVDMVNNSWTYEAINVDGVTRAYYGDRVSQTLELTATAPRLQTQVCHFCPNNPVAQHVDDLTTFFFSSSVTVALAISHQFSAYFVDGLGRRVGIVLGKVYNEIPNAQIGFLRGAPAQWSPLGMPMLSVPSDVQGSLRITGLQNVPINVTAFGKGKVVALQNLLVDTTIASEIRLDQTDSIVAIATATQASPDFYVGYSEADQNVEMTIKRVVLQKGAKAAVTANRKAKSVTMLTTNRQPAQLQVIAADANQPNPVAVQTTVPTDDQSLAPIIDAIAPASVQDELLAPTDSAGAAPATSVARRNLPSSTPTTFAPTPTATTNGDASTAGNDKVGGSSGDDITKNNGDSRLSTVSPTSVVTSTVSLTPAGGADNHTSPTPTDGADNHTSPTPTGGADNHTTPTPTSDADNHTSPTPDHHSDSDIDGGDTAHHNASSPTMTIADQTGHVFLEKTPSPTRDSGIILPTPQYVPPTVVVTNDDNIGKLRE